jgi:hypothetical protein
MIQTASRCPAVHSHQTISLPSYVTRPAEIPRTNHFNNFSLNQSSSADHKRQSGTLGRVLSPPFQRREITPRAYTIPHEFPQNDQKNYDISNAERTASSSWHEISNDVQNTLTQNKSPHTHAVSLPSGGSGLGAQTTTGGSYRGFGSSSGSGFGSGSKAGGSEYPYSLQTPYAQDRSSKTFKTYNVSPMVDATSLGEMETEQRQLLHCTVLYCIV